VYVASDALLYRPYGTFDFSHVIIGGGRVEGNWKDIVADTFKFTVGVDVRDLKTPRAVKVQDGIGLQKGGTFGSIGDGS
jgi:hypothetical protein